MTNKDNTVLYTGVTGNILRCIQEYKEKVNESITKRYNVNKLVYYEVFDNPNDAIAREKQIKAGPRRKRLLWLTHLTLNGENLMMNYWDSQIASPDASHRGRKDICRGTV